MEHFSLEDFGKMPSRNKAHLINSCTGYKSANLIGTRSKNDKSNLAIFNSVVHIGSNPPLLGFVLRPLTARRDTYNNMKETGYFTVNQINKDIIQDAHHTSASYKEDISEFSKTNLTEIFLDNFHAPYVGESKIKLGCKIVNEYEIKENGCLLIIGAIEHIYVPENILKDDGWLRLDDAETIAINGLDTYAIPKFMARFQYAKPDEPTKTLP